MDEKATTMLNITMKINKNTNVLGKNKSISGMNLPRYIQLDG